MTGASTTDTDPAEAHVSVSIVVPTRNEARSIESSIESARSQALEIIVVDCGSTDGTPSIARSSGAEVRSCEPGRARQMNDGAAVARGAVVLFLHADTCLPDGWLSEIAGCIASGSSGWGRFDVRFDERHVLLDWVAQMMNWRSALTGICTGDQAIFVEKARWQLVGGFPRIDLMEDIAMSRKLRRRFGPPLRVLAPVTVSARRWRERGVVRTIVQMWMLRAAYYFGVDPARLHRIYYGRASN